MVDELHNLWVPAIFWDDHMSRDCMAAASERRSGNQVHVDLTAAALEDLESDAEFYVDMLRGGEDWARTDYGRSVCRSAQRTRAAIIAYRTQRA